MLTSIFIAGLFAFALSIILMPFFIRFYQMKKISGQQMHEDVKQHLAKAGTPTMGGTVFLAVALLVSLIMALFPYFQYGCYWFDNSDLICPFYLWNHWLFG